MKRIIATAVSFILIFTLSLTAFGANPVKATDEWLTDWSDRASASGKIWQLPGKDSNDRVFNWLSENFGNTFTYSDGTNSFTLNAKSSVMLHGILNTVEIKDIPDGDYAYTYTADGKTFDGSFSVSANAESFTVMFCADPQLGRSGENSEEAVKDDTYGWERTLISAKNNGAELILSAGDQVNDGFSLTQYNALFSPDVSGDIPFAPTAGNHDFYSPLFPLYFGNSGTDSIGNNYYFSYNNALFIVLDSNNIIQPVHNLTITKAISDYPDAEWRVIMLHHGAYSSCADEFTNKVCAGSLKSAFDKFDIDLVLSGHNHFYSRTYPIYNGGIGALGTVYFEAGSASGSKCSSYDTSDDGLIVKSFDLSGASYSLLTFTENTIEVNSYLTDSGEVFDSFTVVNTGAANAADVSFLAAVIKFFRSVLALIPALY